MTDMEELEYRAVQVAEQVTRGFELVTDMLESHGRRIQELEDQVRLLRQRPR